MALSPRSLTAAPRPTPEFFTGTYNNRPFTYQVINGLIVVEGDMVIGEATIRTNASGRRTAAIQKIHADAYG